MAYRSWTIELDGDRHNVGMEHGFWSGKRAIALDGETVERSCKFIDTGS